MKGTAIVATGTLSGGSVSVPVSTLTVGVHTLFARYVGGGNYVGSDSGTFTITVTSASSDTTTTLTSDLPGGSVFTQPVTFTATVTSDDGTPTGTVNFLDNGSVIGSAALNGSGVATFTISTLSIGTHPITAEYLGDTTFNGSTSPNLDQVVNKANTTITLNQGTPNPSAFNQLVTFTASVVAAAPGSGAVTTGTVNFLDNGSVIGSAALNGSGVATFTISTLSIGTHPITAQFTGTTSFNASAFSNQVNQTVGAVGTATDLVSSGPTFVTQPATFTATVTATAGIPQGSVTFSAGGTVLGTVGLSNVGGQQKASLTVSSLPGGVHTISATYNPVGEFTTSSDTVSQVVQKIPTITSLSTAAASLAQGTPVTLTAGVLPSLALGLTPTQTVTFLANGTPLGTVAAGTGLLTFQANLPVGTNTITAVYSGDDNHAGSTSSGVVVTVHPFPLAVGGATNGIAAVYRPNAAAGQFDPLPQATAAVFGIVPANVRSAVADVNGDGIPDTVMVTGPGTPIRVAVLNGADGTALVAPFDPFGGDFLGGGFVTAADFDLDRRSEFVVTPDQGGGPRISIFSLLGGAVSLRANFLTIEENFRGGARPGAGDVNRDGVPDLVISAGFLGGPRIVVLNGQRVLSVSNFTADTDKLVPDFFAFSPELRNGAYVAVGDVNADGFGDLVFGAGPGGGPEIRVVSGQQLLTVGSETALANPIADFFLAGDLNNRGGVRVAVTDVDDDGRADVVAGTGGGQASFARVYLGKDFVSVAEPTTFQDLDPFASAVLDDGIYVG
jgi:hypothetical protein